MTKWQTMESAPCEADRPILIATDEGNVCIGFWAEWEGELGHDWFCDDGRSISGALAWMPLPTHPLFEKIELPKASSASVVKLQSQLFKFEADLMAFWADRAKATAMYVSNPTDENLEHLRSLHTRGRELLFHKLFPLAKYQGLTLEDVLRKFDGAAA